MKIGIIRCDSHSDRCSAASCLKAARERSGSFAAYPEATIVGLDTCGGCARGEADRVVARAERLARAGAEVIHLGNCLVNPCPFLDSFAQALDATGAKVVQGTH